MQHIHVIFRHNDVKEEDVKGKHAIIIDVLRATTVMITALSNGAHSARTVSDIQQAYDLKNQEPDIVLTGERDAEIIKGFQFGNSPLDMTLENISGKHICMCTSNGTKAIAAAKNAQEIWIAAFINLTEVARQLSLTKSDIIIICSGTLGEISLDDTWAAGLLINKLTENKAYRLSDSSQMIVAATQDSPPLKTALKDCFHFNILKSKGYQKDLDYCLQLDRNKTIPKWNGDRFTL